MFGTASLWLGQSLVVFDVVFIVVGLPSIVSMTAPYFADFVSSPFPSLFSHLFAAFIASLVAFPFTMFATSELVSWSFGPFYPELCGFALA
ncbi:hypothetical protein Bca101_003228 [Brassica carinata]